jgi:hypothetical protein
MENLPQLVSSLSTEDTKRLISLLGTQASYNSERVSTDGLFDEARVWDDISLTLHVAEEEIASLV